MGVHILITRAIVTGTDYNNAKIQVRIPILEGIRNSRNAIVTDYSNSSASIVCIPGIDVDYKIGDIVVIGFEDNDAGMPIVLGHLMLRGDSTPQSKVYGRFIELSSSESFVAPTNTTIGSTTYQQLFDTTSSNNSGRTGPTGPAGPTGATGPIGATGADGQDGADGVNGLSIYASSEALTEFTQTATLQTASIATTDGRSLQVGDLVILRNDTSSALYRITQVNESDVNAALVLTL